MNETTLMQRIMLAASKLPGVRLFRNNTGFDSAAKVRYGLCVGSSDLIGWKTITIEPKHVYDFAICISNIEERDKLREYLKLAENYELARYEILKPHDHRLFTTIQQSTQGE